MHIYNTVLFDWDGTIVRTLDVWFDCLRLSLENHGYTLPHKQVGANYALFQQRAVSLGVNNVVEILAEAHSRLKQYSVPIPMYDDSIIALQKLRAKHFKIAIVTTSTHSQVDPLIKLYNLASAFDVIICAEDTIDTKPNSEPLTTAISKLGSNKANTVMVGDSATDLQAAQNTGIDSILFYPNDHHVYYDIADLQKYGPTYTARSYSDILHIIL